MVDGPSGSKGESQRTFITVLNEVFAAVAGWSFDHRWIVMGICLAIGYSSLELSSLARIDNSYEAYFDLGDPAYLSYEQYREDFGSDEVSYVLYEVPGAEYGPFDLEIMRKVVKLTKALEDEVPFVYEVKSLVNAELVTGVEDGIEIRKLEKDFPESQEELLALRERFLSKPMLVGGILSQDATHAAIIIKMDRSSTDPPEEIRVDPELGDALENLYPQATDTVIEEIFARPEYSEIRFYHSGDVPLNAVYNRIIASEGGKLDMITTVVIAVILVAFFRSFLGVVAPVVVVQLAVFMCIGFIALLGWKLDMSFGSVPTLLTAIGVAHSVHILSEFRGRFAELGDRREALVQTLYLVGTPCLLASLTTAVGFGSMSFAPIKSISHQGVYAAFGVIAAFVLSLTLLMALLSFGRRSPKHPATERERLTAKGGFVVQRALEGIARFNVRHRVGILVGAIAIFVFSGVGISRMVVDSNWLDDFSYDMPIKAITERVDSVMGGTTNVIYLFDSGESDGIKEPEVLREIERVQEIANEHGWLVRKTYSIVDILKDLNQSFHADDPSWHKLPETRELVAQYLVMYEMSGGEETEETVSSDYRRASLELRIKLAMTSETAKLVGQIEEAVDREPLVASKMDMTGIGALWLKLLEYIVSSQVQGFLTAFFVIALMMVAIFRSLKIGIISMVPNLTPVALMLGAMGWAGIPLDYSKVSIAAVALGIAVDDTIHMVSRYHHEFMITRDYEVSLRRTLTDVGRALFITSVALVAGFLVFLFSVMDSTSTQGILLALTIIAALVADFLLMPALVMTFEPFGPKGAGTGKEPIREAA